MAWTKVGETTFRIVDAAGDPQSVTLPGPPAENDIVIVVHARDAAISVTIGGEIVTSGYTNIAYDEANNSPGHQVAYKIMGATPDTQVQFSDFHASTMTSAGLIQVWRGVDTSTPQDVTAVQNSGLSANADPSSIDPVTEGCLVMAVLLLDDDDDAGVAGPTGYTNFLTHHSGQGGASGATVAIASKDLGASHAAEDPGAFTNTSDDWRTVTIALRPAAGGAQEVAAQPAGTSTTSASVAVVRVVAAQAAATGTALAAIDGPPPAPSALAKGVGSDDANMVLTWTDNSANEDNFHIQRSPQGAATWATVSDAIAADSTTYTDTTVAAETAYDYRLRAENAVGDSAWVELLNVTTAPARVTGLAAVPGSAVGEIDVTWTDNSAAETQYNVYYRVNGSGDPYDVDVIAANSVSHTLTGLTGHATYQIDVRPENSNGVSGSNGTVTSTATGDQNAAMASGVGAATITPAFVRGLDTAAAGVGTAFADISSITALPTTGRRMVVIGIEPNAAQRIIRLHLWYVPVVYAVMSQGAGTASASITVA